MGFWATIGEFFVDYSLLILGLAFIILPELIIKYKKVEKLRWKMILIFVICYLGFGIFKIHSDKKDYSNLEDRLSGLSTDYYRQGQILSSFHKSDSIKLALYMDTVIKKLDSIGVKGHRFNGGYYFQNTYFKQSNTGGPVGMMLNGPNIQAYGNTVTIMEATPPKKRNN